MPPHQTTLLIFPTLTRFQTCSTILQVVVQCIVGNSHWRTLFHYILRVFLVSLWNMCNFGILQIFLTPEICTKNMAYFILANWVRAVWLICPYGISLCVFFNSKQTNKQKIKHVQSNMSPLNWTETCVSLPASCSDNLPFTDEQADWLSQVKPPPRHSFASPAQGQFCCECERPVPSKHSIVRHTSQHFDEGKKESAGRKTWLEVLDKTRREEATAKPTAITVIMADLHYSH